MKMQKVGYIRLPAAENYVKCLMRLHLKTLARFLKIQ